MQSNKWKYLLPLMWVVIGGLVILNGSPFFGVGLMFCGAMLLPES